MTKPDAQRRLWLATRSDFFVGDDTTRERGATIVNTFSIGRLAQDAFRFENHEQDEDREHDRLGPLLAQSVGQTVVEALDETDEHATEHCTLQVADAAEDRKQ